MKENKLNPFVRIRGNAHRGKEVIAELERRGGVNAFNCKGDNPNLWYCIINGGQIVRVDEACFGTLFLASFEEIELPRWRAKLGEDYWRVALRGGCYCPMKTTDDGCEPANDWWEAHNYFSSESEAQAKADAINAILRDDNKL